VAALVAQSVLLADGLSAEQLVVYGDQRDPLGNFRSYAHAIHQDRMRSESSGHFFPSDFPGMALLESLRRRTLRPLLRSLIDRYQPQLDDLLAHGTAVANALEPARCFVPARVGQIARIDEETFALRDESGQSLGTAQHVILAPGHPGLRWPPCLLEWQDDSGVLSRRAEGLRPSAGRQDDSGVLSRRAEGLRPSAGRQDDSGVLSRRAEGLRPSAGRQDDSGVLSRRAEGLRPSAGRQDDPRVRHAYQPKAYHAGEVVLVIGRGMAAAHEWLAALRAGCRVVALSRLPVHHQPLNAPRCDFSASGLDRYRRLNPEDRHAYLDRIAAGSYPWRPEWERELARARSLGMLRMVQAEILSVGLQDERLTMRLANGDLLRADRITAATGFIPDAGAHRVISRLAELDGVALEQGRLIIGDDFCVPPVSLHRSRLSVIGNLARWALPVADTFAGMKYVARRLRPLWGIRAEPLVWLRFQRRLAMQRF